MLENGGNILDAYGLVTVVSPAGLPIRGVVGIAPDPIMYVAINCQDVNESREFYEKPRGDIEDISVFLLIFMSTSLVLSRNFQHSKVSQ